MTIDLCSHELKDDKLTINGGLFYKFTKVNWVIHDDLSRISSVFASFYNVFEGIYP